MRIGHYISVVAGQKGFENNVSGHVQVPLHAIGLLREAGHDVHLITNRFGDDRTLPAETPDVPIHQVHDARKRGDVLTRQGAPAAGVSLVGLIKQLRQIKSLARKLKLDVLHLYGYNRTIQLAGMLQMINRRTPVVATLFGPEIPGGFFARRLWAQTNAIITATQFVGRYCEQHNIHTHQVRHGIVRDLADQFRAEGRPSGPKNRVLFWRDPSRKNGADIALDVFSHLAPRYPDIRFTMAIRPHWEEIQGIDDTSRQHENIEIHRFPYEQGITLPGLIAESILVLMPIRKMSIDPQLVIAESLAAGVPVIATDQRSNNELITPGKNGDLVPLDDSQAAIKSTDKLLSDRPALEAMGLAAAQDLQQRWNWDNYVKDIETVYTQATT